MAEVNKSGRRRTEASSLVIYCTSHAGHCDKILLACSAQSCVGMSSTATNVRALRLSVARHISIEASAVLRPTPSMALLLRTHDLHAT